MATMKQGNMTVQVIGLQAFMHDLAARIRELGTFDEEKQVWTVQISEELVKQFEQWESSQDDKVGPARDSRRCHTREELSSQS